MDETVRIAWTGLGGVWVGVDSDAVRQVARAKAGSEPVIDLFAPWPSVGARAAEGERTARWLLELKGDGTPALRGGDTLMFAPVETEDLLEPPSYLRALFERTAVRSLVATDALFRFVVDVSGLAGAAGSTQTTRTP